MRFTAALCLALATIPLASCSGLPGFSGQQGDAAKAPDYYPFVEGATWTLKQYRYEFAGGSGSLIGSSVVKVQTVESSTAGATASIKTTNFDKDGKETSVSTAILIRANGEVRKGSQGSSTSELQFPFPLVPGEIELEPASGSTSAKVMRITDGKTVVTDAGKFDRCFEVFTSSIFAEQNYSSTRSTAILVAPNVGPIRYETVSDTKFDSSNLYSRYVSEVSTYSIPVTR